MTCPKSDAVVGAHLDGELSGWQGLMFRRHLQRCVTCASMLARQQALSQALQTSLPRHPAPPALRARVLAMAAQANDAPAPRRAPPRRPAWAWVAGSRQGWALGGALSGCVATLLCLWAVTWFQQYQTRADLAQQFIDRHVHATLSQHVIDVASSDQHTVKPWLSERLDYSPPVRDLPDEGFDLLGGRLETVQDRAVATLVYRFKRHRIDVFVRPLPAPAPSGPMERRGFHIAHAAGQGMDFVGVSDLNADALARFVTELAATPPG
jgi:anti-sigma factor RsiW